MTNQCVIITFGIIFFIIGIICYFLGCNPNYESQCYNYNIVDATSKGYDIYKRTCNRCVARNKNGACTSYYYYDCYDTDILFNYGSNSTCFYTIVSGTSNYDYANSKGANYPIGKEKKLLKTNTSKECIDFKQGMDIWISGITFLSLFGLCLLYLIGVHVYLKYESYKNGYSIPK